MAGAQEEFGNRLGEGYMANLGTFVTLFSCLYTTPNSELMPYNLLLSISPTLYPIRHSYLVLVRVNADEQNKHNPQYRNTNPSGRSLNPDD
jgi:hypothetical protein